MISTAGNEQATSVSISPNSVIVDFSDLIYISDGASNSIRVVDPDGGKITFLAGNGQKGFEGDNGPAVLAKLYNPQGMAADLFGNIYICDFGNNRVRVIDMHKVITTVVGNGLYGYSGDHGPATAALLSGPQDVTVGSSGIVYIADYGNHCIRMVGIDTIITTIAGTGVSGYSGDNGLAIFATLYSPTSVSLDSSGRIFIADYGNNCIRMIGTDTIITTIAGSTLYGYSGNGIPAISAELKGPACVHVDSIGRIFISDTMNNRIRVVDTSKIITTFAGTGNKIFRGDNGPAIKADLFFPISITVNSFGIVYIADYAHHRIRKVDLNNVITTIAGNGIIQEIEVETG